jgi:hypothetical protein
MYEPKLEKLTISEILGKDFSEYVLPLIQREYVWDESDIKEMIESLLNGYPVGIITVVKTDIELPSTPLIDVKNDGSKDNVDEKYYILDGQQRLTSLLLIRDGWKIKRLGEPVERAPIYYNPDDNKLRVKGKRSTGHDFSSLIRKAMFLEQSEPYLRGTLEYLRKNFLDRPFAFYTIEIKKGTKKEEEVYRDMAEIFTRINRAGIRLGNLEMFLSFFASASLGKEEITSLHKELNGKFSMDLEPIIRFVFSNLGLTQSQISKVTSFKKAMEDIKERYSKEGVVEVIQKCRESIVSVMDLLRTQLGIITTQILPSETALIPLFQYAYERDAKIIKGDENQMINWFIIASFNGLYSSRTDTRLEDDIEIIKSHTSGFPFHRLLDSMKAKINKTKISEGDFKNIDINILRGTAGKKYIFMLYILLHKNDATDWAGRPLGENFDNLAKHHIFPKEDLRERGEDEITVNHLGNLTFINKAINEELQNRLPQDYLVEYEQVLEKHFIPTDRPLWKLDNYTKFIDKRIQLLWNACCEMLKDSTTSSSKPLGQYLTD